MLRPALFALIALPLLSPTGASAQSLGSGLISTDAARHYGLERMWFTQLALDRGRGRAAGLHLHVSRTRAHTVLEIEHDGKRYVFSERERDAFGKEIGVEGAQAKATEQLAAIEADLKAAGAKDAPLPEVEKHVVPEITLYASSERGTVHAIDGETGQTRWIATVGTASYPTTAPAANDEFVAVLNGSTLYMLQAADGSLVWTRKTIGSPGAGPALTNEMVLIPMLNGHVESLLLDDPKRPLATYQSFGRITVQPIVSYNSVAWPTGAGNLYVGLAREPGMRFRLKARDAIHSAPAFLPPDKVIVTSLDGYVYCVNEAKGNILWRFTTGEPISHSPVALDDRVYAITDRGNLYALDAETSQEQWVASGIKSYVAGNARRLYCIDTRGNLAIVDANTGARLGTLPSGRIDMPLMNVETDRIILVSSTGLVQCFREANLPFPLVHNFDEAAAEAQPRRTPTPTTPAAGDEPMPPAAVDPFAGGAADPFADPAPAAPAAADPADPFATP